VEFGNWLEPNRLADLNYDIRCRIVQETLKTDENKLKRLEKRLLACLLVAQAGLGDH
jgi:hypothetical protein